TSRTPSRSPRPPALSRSPRSRSRRRWTRSRSSAVADPPSPPPRDQDRRRTTMSSPAPPGVVVQAPTPDRSLSLRSSSPRWGEKAVVGWLFLCAAFSVLVTVGIVFSLVPPTVEFFRRVAPWDFFSTDFWAPTNAGNPSFGVLRLVVGTLNVTFWALLIAIPAGLGAAIYLSEYASSRARKVLKPILEVLEGVPTVAYGFFA